PLVPAEAVRADTQALDQLALGEGAAGIFRINLRVVEDAELNRVEREVLGHLVHGNLERHQAGRFARRSHGIAFRKVEHGEAHGGHTVGAGVKQTGLAYRSLQLATRQVAGPALMADGGDLAVAGGANADTLDRRGPMRGVVENQW